MRNLSNGNNFTFLDQFWRENQRDHHVNLCWSGTDKPNQNAGPLGGTFGPTANSKSHFKIFRGESPPKNYIPKLKL